MPEEQSSRKPSRRRRIFRVCRKCVLLLVLLLVCGVIYLNQIGLPGFVKHSLLARLEEQGIQAEFSRLRWRWHEGIVAENLILRQKVDLGGPVFRSTEASVRLDMDRLLRPDWRIASVAVRDGHFSWVLPSTNGLVPLQIEAINAEVAVDPDQSLDLRHFTSRFRDLKLQVSGTFAHPAALAQARDTNAAPRNIELLNQTMTQIANYLTNLQFTAAPKLKLRFQADAADWSTLRADVEMQLPQTRTTWGDAEGFRLLARVRPASATNAEPSCTILLSGRAIETPWGRVEDWRATSHTVPVIQLPLNSSNTLTASFGRLNTRWGAVEEGNLQLVVRALDPGRPGEIDLSLYLAGQRLVTPHGRAGEVTLRTDGAISRTNGLPLHGKHVLTVSDVAGTNFTAALVQARVTQSAAAVDPVTPDDSWGFWRSLAPFAIGFELSGEKVAVRGVQVDSLKLAGDWQAPKLQLREMRGRLYGGDAQFSAEIDVPSREIQAAAEVAFDFHGLDPVFTEHFRNWLAPYQWQDVPHAQMTGKLRWPDWRQLKPGWHEEIITSLGISGQFHVNDVSYRGIPGLAALSDFHFTNFVWNLPNLTLVRPEGRVIASYDGDDRTRDYVWQIRADIDPHALKPLFNDDQLPVFDSFTNHATPHIEGTIRGRWRAHELIDVRAEVTAPRLELRGERADLLKAAIEYTNRFITIRNLEIHQSNRVARAGMLGIDLPGDRMYFTNVDSSLPPQSVARAIGPNTARAVEPYVFEGAPRILLNGVLGLQGHDPTDMKFAVVGGPFHWWRFNLEEIQANLLWRGNELELTNVVSKFYGGTAAGEGSFQFYPDQRPTDFRFALTTTNVQLRPLVQDVFFKTNGLEGALSGALAVTSARTDSVDTWQGFGNLYLRDGVVWDIPLFGIFSPVFNALAPGLGQSRADEALASFSLINGTIISRDLQVRSAELSMSYQGSVDFQGNVEARMQARLLKDSGAFGPLISAVFWPLTKFFEYRLGGTLSEPVAEPIHIPKFLLIALEPFKALQGVLKGVGEAVVPKATPVEAPKP